MKIAVVGATGFVGAALTETLLQDTGKQVLPLIRSAGNAWGLARHGVDLKMVDLLHPDSIEEALEDCTHVVNCSRGSDKVMLKGLNNLIKQCRRRDIKKFVHLSSVAVYGDPPPADSINETAATRPAKGSYGSIKLRQDEMVQSAARAGLPSVILCPPNILGPGSYFLLQLLNSVSAGQFLLAGNGDTVCCSIDVANLVHAIVLAMESEVNDGERLFVTDDEVLTWNQVVKEIVPLVVGDAEIRHVTLDDLRARQGSPENNRLSPIRSLKHLISSDVRAALQKDPLLAKILVGSRAAVAGLGSKFEEKMRQVVAGPIRVPPYEKGPQTDIRLSMQQLRGVMHSCDRAKAQIGYAPLVSIEDSLSAFANWYTDTHGFGSDFANLYQHLYKL